jgi:hypothetical protein
LQALLGVDLLEYFRGRRPWRQLLRFLGRMPAHSHYMAALADDEATARRAAAARSRPAPMTMAGYDPLVSRLDTVIDVLVAAHSTGSRPPRMPRPVTALDRLAANDARARHRARVRMIRGPDTTT